MPPSFFASLYASAMVSFAKSPASVSANIFVFHVMGFPSAFSCSSHHFVEICFVDSASY
jgi:hypothetical protein